MNQFMNTVIALFFIGITGAYSQKPEPVYSFARVHKPDAFYKEQAQAWKQVTEKEPENAMAWYYYFKATRTVMMHAGEPKIVEELDTLVADMGRHIPETFEYNLSYWIAGGLGDFSRMPYLEKARQLGPYRPEIVCDMINIGELKNDARLRDTYCTQWYNSGELSPGYLYYNYNVISGLKPNAIIVTVGDNDTYPMWVLQDALDIRKDVMVLNLYMLQITEYRQRIFKELGIKDFEYNPSAERSRFNTELITRLTSNTKNRPVYAALTAGEEVIGKESANLYLTGLAYEYSKTSIDNMALLKKNFEQVYALDYLDKYFHTADISADWVRNINLNYIIPLLKLREHYQLSGEPDKSTRLKALIEHIAKGTDQEAVVNEYLKSLN